MLRLSRSRRLLPPLLLCGLASGAPAEENGSKYQEMTLNQLLDVKVEIAARQEQTPEQAPSIVTVLTRQELETVGVRDLADALRLAGGFEFGIDVESLVGLAYRGVWVHEGKALLMINGQMVNDFAYGNVNYIGTYPAAMIERIEIIRGPGSALYGGFAEVAVINVITAKGDALKGGRWLAGGGGLSGDGGGTWNGELAFGGVTAEGIDLTFEVGASRRALSGRPYTDVYGTTVPAGLDAQERRWWHAIVQAGTERWRFKYTHLDFRFDGQDVFDAAAPPVNGQYLEQHKHLHDALTGTAKFTVGDRLVLEPLVEYIGGTPLDAPVNAGELFAGYLGTNAYQSRLRLELAAAWALPRDAQLQAGVGWYRDRAHDIADNGSFGFQLSPDPNRLAPDVEASAQYVYAQYGRSFGAFGVTLGGRYEDTHYGSAFAPRAGVTWVDGRFNAKLLYGRAYRIPTLIQNFERDFLGLSLVPETADSLELETGWKFTRGLSLKLNLFQLKVNKPIVYNGFTNTYGNSGRLRSHGAESELRWRSERWGAFVNAAWTKPGSGTSAVFVDERGNDFLGQPPLKVNAGGEWRRGRFRVSPTLTWLAARRGQTAASVFSSPFVAGTERHPALWLANLALGASLPGEFQLDLRGHNLNGEKYVLLQPYYGGHAPLPAFDREWSLTLSRRF